jgi:two-component system response regulator NreC
MVKVLLAEGNLKIRTLLKSLVETREDFTVCGEAKDGIEAIYQAVKLKPDVAVLDFAMSGLNGLQVGAQLSKTFPEIGIVLHTFHAFDEMISQAKRAGIQEVVSKGAHGGSLLEAIERCSKKKRQPTTLSTTSIAIEDDGHTERSLEIE